MFLHDYIQDMHFWQKCHKREKHRIRRHLRVWPIIGNINFESIYVTMSVNQEVNNSNIDSYESLQRMNQILKMCDIQKANIYSH